VVCCIFMYWCRVMWAVVLLCLVQEEEEWYAAVRKILIYFLKNWVIIIYVEFIHFICFLLNKSVWYFSKLFSSFPFLTFLIISVLFSMSLCVCSVTNMLWVTYMVSYWI
jgi:hypothetical protein